MLYEAAVDLFGRTTALTPVEDKFGAHRLGEDNIDAGLRQNIQRILTRHPVPAEGWRYTDFKRLWLPSLCLALLSVSPACKHELPKLGIDLSALCPGKLRGDARDKVPWNTVGERNEVLERSAGLPSPAFSGPEFSSRA